MVLLLSQQIAGKSALRNILAHSNEPDQDESEGDNLIDTTSKKEKSATKASNSDSLVSTLTLIGAIRILVQSNKRINYDWVSSLLKGEDCSEKKSMSILSVQQSMG
jgi:hypothetical protein